MTDDWLKLAPGEAVVWEGRPRLSAALPSVVGGLLLVVVGLVLAVLSSDLLVLLIGVTLAIVGVFVAAWGLLVVKWTRYLVTDRSLALRRGLFTRTVTSIPLGRVQDSSFTQDLFGRTFGYGTVSIETAGGDSFSFDRIDDPMTVRRLVDPRRSTSIRGRRRPGSAEQWKAVLTEVRALRVAFEGRDESNR